MCLILFAYKTHPIYKLIVASNRDEFYDRPTASLQFWEDYPYILAGRDLLRKGTWMGVTKSGRFAALTNVRNPSEHTEGKLSRGNLVADFLISSESPIEYMMSVSRNKNQFPGFNLLAGDLNDLFYYSNYESKIKKLEPGIYGVSNHLLDTAWPKVKFGKSELENIIEGQGSELVQHLLTLLQNSEQAPDHLLPKTGVSLEWERLLSPLFIKSEKYGSRSSSVILQSDNEIQFTEQVYSKKGIKKEITSFSIDIRIP